MNPCLSRRQLTEINSPLQNTNFVGYVQEPPLKIRKPEARNTEIVKRISDTINRGEKVVIWPSNIQQKDINDMVLAGHNVMSIVENNIYSNLEANVQLNTWKRI